MGPDSLGRYIERQWTESELDAFRKDPNYFVSVNEKSRLSGKENTVQLFQILNHLDKKEPDNK